MISVIMPVYKTDASILRRAILSVVAQEESEWILYIIDDNDKTSPYYEVTRRVSKEFSKDLRICMYQDGINKGANAARNIGLHQASGDIVAFLDSDDTWETGYLSFVKQYFRKNQDAVLLSSSYQIQFSNRIQIMRQKTRKEYIFPKELLADQMSPTTCVAARKDVLMRAGEFDEKLKARQDYDMWIRACVYGKAGFTNRIFATLYRDGIGHESISSNYMRHIQATEVVLQKILKRNDLTPRQMKAIKASQYRYMGLAAMKNQDTSLAKYYAQKMWESKPSWKTLLFYILCVNHTLYRIARYAKIKIKNN